MHKYIYSRAPRTPQVLDLPCYTPLHVNYTPDLSPETSLSVGTAKNRSTRSERLKAQAFIAVQKQDATFRTGALNCRMPLYTFHRYYHKQSQPTNSTVASKRGRKPPLTPDEEK